MISNGVVPYFPQLQLIEATKPALRRTGSMAGAQGQLAKQGWRKKIRAAVPIAGNMAHTNAQNENSHV